MKKIRLETWKRQRQFELFKGFDFPHMSITASVEITEFMRHARSRNFSVFNAILFSIMKTANSIDEFRTRFSNGEIYVHDTVHPSFTVPIADDQFAFCKVAFSEDRKTFDEACRLAKSEAEQQTELKENTSTEDHWIYLSCTPWLDFTAGHHPVANAADCIPRIAWGKITNTDDCWTMPVNLQVHHSLVDGLHIAKFYEILKENLKDI
ncbi:CatA-like O-acetyltransferase [Sneathiella marina]|uniref:CatA-like O-acetyltransferase n=1 Tax=Sneathiella marina TaxID=2950108 RepID=A0ABY4W2E6_9PROT|nr:CatA-like O-acetyltransferase [Sneathiella marina]USG60047.1 CatA-like O-acetyltransferase [Sneathiella marina]